MASTQPTITDADDSIVLSDLVRTGEASRLRRRGALRLDRNSIHLHPSNPNTTSLGPSSTRRPLGYLDPEDSDSDEETRPRPYSFVYGQNDLLDRRHRTFTAHQHQYSSYSRWAEEDPESDDESMSYILVCGGELDSVPFHANKNATPFAPSILPVTPIKLSSSGSSGSGRPTNGCGSIIHFSASSSFSHSNSPSTSTSHHHHTYTARSPATDIVVPLSAEYFHSYINVRFESSSCGCVKEGIGCSVCGNPLGTRWRFCERMAEGSGKTGLFSSGGGSRRRQRRGPLGPEGPRYWGGSPSSRTPVPPASRNPRAEEGEDDQAGNTPPCPTPGPSSSSTSMPLTPSAESPRLELYTFFSSSVTAYADPSPTYFSSSSSLPKSPTTPLPPTEPNSPLSSPVFAPSSPRPRHPMWQSYADGSVSDSDSERGIEFAAVINPSPGVVGLGMGVRDDHDDHDVESQEVDIQFGISPTRFPDVPLTISELSNPGLDRRRSMPDLPSVSRRVVEYGYDGYGYTIAPPLFDRQFTASPEPIPDSPVESRGLMGRMDADGNVTGEDEYPFDEIMSSLRDASSSMHLSPGQVQPQPQPMSFYEQQVLGAWERQAQRERERQRQRERERERNEESQFDRASLAFQQQQEWINPYPPPVERIQLSRTVILRQPVNVIPSVPWRTDVMDLDGVEVDNDNDSENRELRIGAVPVPVAFDFDMALPSARPVNINVDEEVGEGGGTSVYGEVVQNEVGGVFFDR